jgi:hypothetical protein
MPTMLLIAALGFFFGPAAHPAAVDNAQGEAYAIEVYREEGWPIPGLEGKGRRRVAPCGPKVKDDPITCEEVRAAPHAVVTMIRTLGGGRVEIHSQPVNVLRVTRFSVAGRVFAYFVVTAMVSIEEGRRIDLGDALHLEYYDEHGTGRLTTMRWMGSRGPGLIVPAWAKELTRRQQ